MSKIDDIFRDGLYDKGLKYSKSDWKAMAALLNHQASFSFRYRWWIRSSVVLMITSFSMLIYLCDFDTKGKDTIATSNQEVNKNQSYFKEPSINFEDKKSLKDLNKTKPSSTRESTIADDAMTVVIPEKKQNNFVSSTDYDTDDHNLNNPKISGGINVNSVESRLNLTQRTISNSERDGMNLNTNNLADEKLNQKDIIEYKDQTSEQKFNSSIVLEDLKQETLGLDPYGIDGFKYDHNPNIKNIGVLKSPYSRWSFYASAYIKSIQYQTTIRLNNLVDESNHKSNEHEIRSLGYGLNLAAQKNRLKFTSGLGVMTLQQKTNYVLSTIEKTYITKKKLLNRNYIISPRGTSIALIGDVVVDITTTTIQRDICVDCISNFDYWTIPFQVDYQTMPRNRISFFGGLGMNIDILKKTNGYFTATADNGVLDVVELEENLLNNTLIRISGSVGLRYGLTKSWGIRSSYQYGYGINSMLKSYDQLPQTKAIQFGVEYKIR